MWDRWTKEPRDLLLALTPAVIVLLLGLMQFYLAKTHDLSPWRAGGYGMFSTANDINLRSVKARFRDSGESVPQFAERYRQALLRFRVMPSRELLGRIAESAACLPDSKGAVVLAYWEGSFVPEAQGVRFERRYEAEAACPTK